MALLIQYDLFESNDDVSQLHRDFDALELQLNNVRKGLFARHNQLNSALSHLLKLYLQQQEEIANLKQLLIK